jgi:hypothetical protein
LAGGGQQTDQPGIEGGAEGAHRQGGRCRQDDRGAGDHGDREHRQIAKAREPGLDLLGEDHGQHRHREDRGQPQQL